MWHSDCLSASCFQEQGCCCTSLPETQQGKCTCLPGQPSRLPKVCNQMNSQQFPSKLRGRKNVQYKGLIQIEAPQCSPGLLAHHFSGKLEHCLYNHIWLGHKVAHGEIKCVPSHLASHLKQFHTGMQGPHARELPRTCPDKLEASGREWRMAQRR